MGTIATIAWVSYHRRTELLAEHLGSTLHFVSAGRQGDLLRLPWRYLVQTRRTWSILVRERPDVILVQNPPIFLALVVWAFCRSHGGGYVIDSHTGAFVSPGWARTLWLHRLLSHSALTTLVHNVHQEDIVARWGCPHFLLAYTPGDFSVSEPVSLGNGFNVAVISSFREDEPTDAVFLAAHRCPDVQFYFTGNPHILGTEVLAQKPKNCHLLGYLPYRRYVGLLRAADAVMTLTTRDHTLLMGGFETLSIGKPLITSDWPVLRDYFYLGTAHVHNTPADIAEGVRAVQADHAKLQRDILTLRDIRDEEWRQKIEEIRSVMWQGTTSG